MDPKMNGAKSGWLFVPGKDVPDEWQGRAVHITMVSLTEDELRRFASGEVESELDVLDEQIIRKIADGEKTQYVARDLGVSLRTVQRRLAQLRRRYGADSTVELAGRLGMTRRWHEEAAPLTQVPIS